MACEVRLQIQGTEDLLSMQIYRPILWTMKASCLDHSVLSDPTECIYVEHSRATALPICSGCGVVVWLCCQFAEVVLSKSTLHMYTPHKNGGFE